MSSPDFRSRIPSTSNLPRVSGGMPLTANAINSLSEGIDRISIRKGKGYTFKQTSGGLMLNIPTGLNQFPWKCVRVGDHLYINVGKIWGNGIMEHPNRTLQMGVAYTSDDVYFGGRTLFVDIDKATAISSDSLVDGENGTPALAVPALSGYYFIQYVVWESNDTLVDDEASDKALNTKQFVLKYQPLSQVLPKTNIYPVCEIQDDGLLIQGITSDIYYAPQIQTHPFQIYITDFEGDAYAEVAMGTLCNIEAQYDDGIALGDPDGGVYLGTSGQIPDGVTYFWLHARTGTRLGNPVFPSTSEGVILESGSAIPNSGNSDAYVGVGRIVVTDGEPKIEQFVTGSLWGEYFKVGNKPAEYWFSRI